MIHDPFLGNRYDIENPTEHPVVPKPEAQAGAQQLFILEGMDDETDGFSDVVELLELSGIKPLLIWSDLDSPVEQMQRVLKKEHVLVIGAFCQTAELADFVNKHNGFIICVTVEAAQWCVEHKTSDHERWTFDTVRGAIPLLQQMFGRHEGIENKSEKQSTD